MSSPIFTMRSEPQHEQVLGASSTLRSRGRCSGNAFFTGLRRSKGATFVVFCSALTRSSAASSMRSPSCNSSWSSNLALRSALRPYLSRLRMAISSLRPAIIASEVETTARALARSVSAIAARCSEAASAVRKSSSSERASDMVNIYNISSQKPSKTWAFGQVYPTFPGRCVQRGLRQSIPSRRYPSCAEET